MTDTHTDRPAWLAGFPSTNGTIVTGLALAVLYVVSALGGDLTGHPLSATTHGYMSFFITALIGLNVAQFASKRFSDRDYAAAKASGPSPVTVEAPSRVSIQQDGAAPDPARPDTISPEDR